MQVHDTIEQEVSDIFHKYIHDLDGSDPEELVQVVMDALNDFVTEFPVITVRTVLAAPEGTALSQETYRSNF